MDSSVNSRGNLNLEFVMRPLGRRNEAIPDDTTANTFFPCERKVKERSRKGQNRIKTGQKGEAWRSREIPEAVTVDRARKTKENKKRMNENAYTSRKLLRRNEAIPDDATANTFFPCERKVKERSRKGQNRIKTGQKREAWRSRKIPEAVRVDRARKTKENKKRMNENAYTSRKLLRFKEEKKREGPNLQYCQSI
nr:hypothetical protein [Tanacetum cinerariifolium]